MANAVQIASISRRERNINTPIGAFNKTLNHSDMARWVCIYPAYINNKKSLAEGRKVPTKLGVENPTCVEIRDVLQNAGFKVVIEKDRVHPRELFKYEMLYRGRVRVQLKSEDNTPVNQNLATRDALLKYLGETIPKLKTRSSGSQSKQSSQQTSSSDQSKASKKKRK